LLSSVFQLIVLIHVIVLNIKIKVVKLVKFHVISAVVRYKSGFFIYKIIRGMNTFLYGVFVSPHGGLGGPPCFFGLLIRQRRGDRAVECSFTSYGLYIYQTNPTSFNHSTNIKFKVQIIKRLYVAFPLTFHQISFKRKYSHPLFSKTLGHMPNMIILKCSTAVLVCYR
jgi:hypothetical protein